METMEQLRKRVKTAGGSMKIALEIRRAESINRNKNNTSIKKWETPETPITQPGRGPSGCVFRFPPHQSATGEMMLKIYLHPGNLRGEWVSNAELKFSGPDSFLLAGALEAAGLMPDGRYLNRHTGTAEEDTRLRKIVSGFLAA